MNNFISLNELDGDTPLYFKEIEFSNNYISNKQNVTFPKITEIVSFKGEKILLKSFNFKYLKALYLPNDFNDSINDFVLFGEHLELLSVGNSWNPINTEFEKIDFKNIKKLILGKDFDTFPLINTYSNKIEFIEFKESKFDHSINKIDTPFLSEIVQLKLSRYYNSIIDLDFLNTDIIIFGNNFNKPLKINKCSYKLIKLGESFKNKIIINDSYIDTLDLKNCSNITFIDFELNECSIISNLELKETQIFLIDINYESDLKNNKFKQLVQASKNINIWKNVKNFLYSIKNYDGIKRISSIGNNYDLFLYTRKTVTSFKRPSDHFLKMMKKPSIFLLTLKYKRTKYMYNVPSKFYNDEGDDVKKFHRLYNGEFSVSGKYITEKLNKIDKLVAFNYYFGNPQHFQIINKILRGEKTEMMHLFQEEKIAKIAISKMINVFSNEEIVPRLRQPLIVRRCLSKKFIDDEKEFYKKGNKIIDRAFLSTSFLIHYLLCYQQFDDTDKILIVLYVPPGVPCISAGNYFGNSIEKEVLLPPGIEYTVLDSIRKYKITDDYYDKIFLCNSKKSSNLKKYYRNDDKNKNNKIDILFCAVTGWYK